MSFFFWWNNYLYILEILSLFSIYFTYEKLSSRCFFHLASRLERQVDEVHYRKGDTLLHLPGLPVTTDDWTIRQESEPSGYD